MATILLRFIWQMSGSEQPYPANQGALFYRWLPDDQADAIEVLTGTTTAEMRLWMERRGTVHNKFVIPDFKKHEIDPAVLAKQAIVGTSHLFGQLELTNVSQGELAAIVHDKIGDAEYLAFAKRVINAFVYPHESVLEYLPSDFRSVLDQATG